MARVTIKALQTELADARTRIETQRSCVRESNEAKNEAEAALKESREHFVDLKERLANAEAEIARLRGYLDRVHEDDIVRDGMVEIEDANGKRQVPKRPPPMQAMRQPITRHDLYDDLSGNRKKRTHWTNY